MLKTKLLVTLLPIFTQWGVPIVIIGTEIKLKEPDPGNAGGGSAIGNIPASLVSF